jgi:putative FmdB family regulatory protein
MPIYEYQCQKCGTIQEALQNFSDKPLTRCRRCSGRLHKLVSRSSFHLKGTGWYVTDYANRPKDGSAPSEKKTESVDSSKPEKAESPAKETSTSSEKKLTKKKGAHNTKKP